MPSIVFQLDGDEAKAVKAFMSILEAQKKVEKGNEGIGDSAKKASEDQKKAADEAAEAWDFFGDHVKQAAQDQIQIHARMLEKEHQDRKRADAQALADKKKTEKELTDIQAREARERSDLEKRLKVQALAETQKMYTISSGQMAKSTESVSSVVGTLAGRAIPSIGTAVAAAGLIFNAEMDGMRERAKTLANEVDEVKKSLASSGPDQLSLLPQVRDGLKNIASSQFTEEQKSKVFSEISRELGVEATPQQKLMATKYAIQAGETGIDPVAFGKTYGELSKDALKGMAPDRVADVTTQLLKSTKGQGLDSLSIRFLNRWKAGGGDPLKALDLLAAAGRSEESGKTLTELIKAGDEDINLDFTQSEKKRKVEVDPVAKAQHQQLRAQEESIQRQGKTLEDQRTQQERTFEDERMALDRLPKTQRKSELKRREALRDDLQAREVATRREFEDKKASLGRQREVVRQQINTLEDEEVMVAPELDEEKQRKVRLAEIPKEQRGIAMLADPTLAPAGVRAAIRSTNSDMEQGEMSEGSKGALKKILGAHMHLLHTNREYRATFDRRSAEVRADEIKRQNEQDSLQQNTRIDEELNDSGIQNQYLRDLARKGLEMKHMWNDASEAARKSAVELTRKRGPVEVRVQTTPRPARNGGNPDESGGGR